MRYLSHVDISGNFHDLEVNEVNQTSSLQVLRLDSVHVKGNLTDLPSLTKLEVSVKTVTLKYVRQRSENFNLSIKPIEKDVNLFIFSFMQHSHI